MLRTGAVKMVSGKDDFIVELRRTLKKDLEAECFIVQSAFVMHWRRSGLEDGSLLYKGLLSSATRA